MAAAVSEGESSVWTAGLRAAFQSWVQGSAVGFSPATAQDVAREMGVVLLTASSTSSTNRRRAAPAAAAAPASTKAELWARVGAAAGQPRLRNLVGRQRGARGQWSLALLRDFCRESSGGTARLKRRRQDESEEEAEEEEEEEESGSDEEDAEQQAAPRASPGGGGYIQDTISSAFRRWLEAPDPRTGRGRISSERTFFRYAGDAVPLAVREWFWVAAREAGAGAGGAGAAAAAAGDGQQAEDEDEEGRGGDGSESQSVAGAVDVESASMCVWEAMRFLFGVGLCGP